jgi:hypothetical protein
MGELEALSVDDESWGAKALVMKENVEHHMEEEEGDMFKKAEQVFDAAELDDLGQSGWRNENIQRLPRSASQCRRDPTRHGRRSSSCRRILGRLLGAMAPVDSGGLLGEPDRLDYVSLREETVSVMLRFGDLPVAIHWINLPGIARYAMEFALYGPDRRVSLTFPSPFLRNAPTPITVEAGDPRDAGSSASEEVTSFDSGFKRELVAFHEAIVNGGTIPTPGRDAMLDIALCQAIIECARSGRPIDQPTRV